MRTFHYAHDGNDRAISFEDLPLSVGTGPHAKLQIHRSGSPIIAGHLNRSAEGGLLFEPSGAVDITYGRCKKQLPPPREPGAEADGPPPPVPEPTWDHSELISRTELRDGDYLLIGNEGRIDISFDDGIPRLTSDRGRRTVVQNVERARKRPKRRGGLGCFGSILLLLFLALLAGAAVAGWLFMTSKRVSIATNPAIEDLKIEGGWMPEIDLGEQRLMRKGTYRATGTLEGHHPLDELFAVGDDPNQTISFSMRPLPGIVHVTTEPPTSSPVTIGSNQVGNTELRDHELEIGTYPISVAPERYLPETTSLDVEGYGKEQTVRFQLTPRWSDITITSPNGASVQVDNKIVGTSPLTFELFEGPHQITLRKELHEPFQTNIVVQPNTPINLPPINMVPSPAHVRVTSTPEGAKVTLQRMGGFGHQPEYKGETPTEFEVAPFVEYQITVVKLGYGTKTESIKLGPTQRDTVVVNMSEQRGLVKVIAEPASAQLYINGKLKGYANRPVYLPAVPQNLEVRLAGYESYSQTVTPTPGFEQVVTARLRRIGGGIPGGRPGGLGPSTSSGGGNGGASGGVNPAAVNRGAKYRSEGDYEFIRIQPGPFKMGAPRSEQGRRSNEAYRNVTLSRPFYMGKTEVSIAQFKAFNPGYRTVSWSGASLAGDLKPVVSVTWAQAAAYCNWLSEKDGLPKAYEKLGVEYRPVNPMNTGYRLPSEAEWEYCARFVSPGNITRKFPWGDAMPPKPNSCNIAGTEASNIISSFLPSHSDGAATTADCGSFRANPLGLFDMGGNVSEWCNDGYKVYVGSNAETDPLGPAYGPLHTFKGPSWRDASMSNLRFAYRGYEQKAQPYIGFRVARYAQ